MRRLAALVVLGGCQVVFPLDDTSGTTFDGLVAHYSMNAVSALSVADLAHGHDGLCGATGCPTVTPGPFDKALLFDGVDDNLRVAPAAAFDGSAGFTVALWIRVDGKPNSFGSAVTNPLPGAPNDSWAWHYDGGSQTMNFETTHLNTGASTVTSRTSPIAFGDWHHIAGTWDGGTKITYLDGAPLLTEPIMLPMVFSPDSPVVIGADININATEFPFPGAIDELQIYDHALTEIEVHTLALPP